MEHNDFDPLLQQPCKADRVIPRLGESEAMGVVGEVAISPWQAWIRAVRPLSQPLLPPHQPNYPQPIPPGPRHKSLSLARAIWGDKWPECLPSGFTKCPQQSPTPLDLSCLPCHLG